MKTDKDIDELMADNAISETLIRDYKAEIERLRELLKGPDPHYDMAREIETCAPS